MNSLVGRCDLSSFDNVLNTNPQIKWTNIYAFVIGMDFFSFTDALWCPRQSVKYFWEYKEIDLQKYYWCDT